MQQTVVYFDGLRPVQRAAEASLTGKGLSLSVESGPPFLWDYASIRLSNSSDTPLRFHREQSGAHTGEILQMPPSAFSDALKARCSQLSGERGHDRKRVILWSAAALASLLALVVYGIPALADRLAPLVPWSTEVTLGNAVEGQILQQLSDGKAPRLCTSSTGNEGTRALQLLVDRLTQHAPLPGKAEVRIVDMAMQNAFTLPGGKILLMRGLIDKAESADEVAGVLAHELGHMVHRDAMRGLIHAGGVSFLIGTMLGDFTGAGALIIGSKFLIGNRYSRDNESQADAFAIEVITKAGGDVTALARFLNRVAKSPGERQMELLLSHPVTEDRVTAIERAASATGRQSRLQPILNEAEWQSLRKACAPS